MDVKIAAAYIRVSTDDQLEYSPDSQLKLIREHAKREGYIVPEEYVYSDDGISGKSADKRPAFRLMIAAAKEKDCPFSCIFVWKFSRFARNQEESIMYKNLLAKKGVSVRSISEPSSDSPFASLIERIIEWMDEYYIINLATEVRRGMAEKASRGEPCGNAPVGYRVENHILVPDDSAGVVQYVFEQYAAGKGARHLAVELGEMGVKTRRGNPPDNRWVQYMLQNPVYAGKIRFSTEGHAHYGRADYNGENVMIVDGKHEPIISQALFDAVQQRLSATREIKYVRSKEPRIFALKGLIRCGDCGSTLTYISTAAPSLQCHKYAKGLCTVSHGVTVSKITAAVIDGLTQLVDDGNYRFSPAPAPAARPARDWSKLISAEEQRLARARSALLDGAFTAEEYRALKVELADNIKRLRAAQAAEQEDAKKIAPSPDDMREKVLNVIELLKSPDISEAAKNEALRGVISKIVFNKPGNTLDFYFI